MSQSPKTQEVLLQKAFIDFCQTAEELGFELNNDELKARPAGQSANMISNTIYLRVRDYVVKDKSNNGSRTTLFYED